MRRIVRTLGAALVTSVLAALVPALASVDGVLPAKLRSGEQVRWTPTDVETITRVLRAAGTRRAEAAELAQIVHSESAALDVDPLYALALMKVESNYRANAVSPQGAVGLLQVRPEAARVAVAAETDRRADAIGPPLGVAARSVRLRDPRTNVAVGLRYLQHLEGEFADTATALAAYNLGPTRVRRHLEQGTPVPRDYADRVLATYRALRATR